MNMPKWPEWETVREIGRGSFGGVYEIHKQVFERTDKAALKVITIPQSSSDIDELYNDGYDVKSITDRYKNYLEDIVKEYNLMASLKGNHNIVYCDDLRYIQHDDGIGWDIYIKMELLTPLTKVYEEPIDEQQVIKLGIDMCNALIACKSQSIVHRDIKPQNIFVTNSGDFKLGDFGIAKTAERTTSGTKTGTYKYMAPEVYNNQPYGASSDLYSLGMVLYWMLNQRRTPFLPLPPTVPTATQDNDARHKRMNGEKIPSPVRGSESLKRIVLKACEYHPADRFASPEEMKKALLSISNMGNSVFEKDNVDSSMDDGTDYDADNDNTQGVSWDDRESENTQGRVKDKDAEDKTEGVYNKGTYRKNTETNGSSDINGLDLHMELALSQRQLNQGCQKKITINQTGEKLMVYVPKGMKDGGVLRLKDKGLKDPVTRVRGNLMIKLLAFTYDKKKYKNNDWSGVPDIILLEYINKSPVGEFVIALFVATLLLFGGVAIAAFTMSIPIGVVAVIASFAVLGSPSHVGKNQDAAKREWNRRHPNNRL